MKELFSYVAIPCDDFERAYKFYYAITNGLLRRNENVPFPMAYFVNRNGKNIGHLFHDQRFQTSQDGVMVYFESDKELSLMLSEIDKAGGTIVMPKSALGPGRGYWAIFLDTEGNKLALHSDE